MVAFGVYDSLTAALFLLKKSRVLSFPAKTVVGQKAHSEKLAFNTLRRRGRVAGSAHQDSVPAAEWLRSP
jgi:hypothetical protein